MLGRCSLPSGSYFTTMFRIATTRLILSLLTLSQLSQYIPYIVRSLILWWLDPVCKLTHALYGLGRPFEICNSKRKLFYCLSNAPPSIVCGRGLPCTYRTAMRLLPTSDNCDHLIFRGKLRKKDENHKENVKKKRKHRFYYKSLIIVILQYHFCSLCNFLFSFPFPHAKRLLSDAAYYAN